MGSTEQKTLQSILQAIIDQGNATVTQVNGQIASGTGNLEVVKDLKLQELVGATANHTITLEAKAQELIQLISEQGLRIRINQPSHGFLFNPVQFDTTANKYVKATVSTGADAMAIKVTDDFFDLVSSGSYVIPQGAVDSKGAEFVIDDFYFLDATGAGLIARDEPIRYYQPLFLVYSDRGIKTASINVNPMVDKLAQIVMPDGLNGFQLEEDMRLHTEAKSVVGGINELKSRTDGHELNKLEKGTYTGNAGDLKGLIEQNKTDILLRTLSGGYTGTSADLKVLIDGVTNESGSGWWKDRKTGLIIQFGEVSGGGASPISFPITFSSIDYTVALTPILAGAQAGSGADYRPFFADRVSGGFWFYPMYANAGTGGNPNQFYREGTRWFAIGF